MFEPWRITVMTVAAVIMLPFFLLSLGYGLYHRYLALRERLKSVQIGTPKLSTAKIDLSFQNTVGRAWQAVIQLGKKVGQGSVLVQLAWIGFCLIFVARLFEGCLPRWLMGTLAAVALISFLYLYTSLVTSKISSLEDLILPAITVIILALTSIAALALMLSDRTVPFNLIVVLLVVFLVPLLSLIRSVLSSAMASATKIWMLLFSFIGSVLYVLFLFGLFNIASMGDAANGIELDTLPRLVLRVAHYGAQYFFDFPDPTPKGPLAPFAQYLVGFLFLSLVIGSFASAFSSVLVPDRKAEKQQ